MLCLYHVVLLGKIGIMIKNRILFGVPRHAVVWGTLPALVFLSLPVLADDDATTSASGNDSSSSNTAAAAAPAPAEAAPAAAAPASADPAGASAGIPSSAAGELPTTAFDTVNVTSSTSPIGIVPEYAARSRSTVTPRDFKQMVQGGAMDTLKDQPGISYNSNDNTGMSGFNFTVRGMSSDQIGVTSDGIPANDSGNYALYPNLFGDPENLERMSLTQGSSYGSSPNIGASGGSIEVRTRKPSKTPGAFVKQSVGSNDLKRSFVRFDSGQYGGFSSWISYSNTFAHKWKGNGNIKGQRVEGGAFYDWGDGNTTELIAKYSEQKNYNYATVSSSQFAHNKKRDFSNTYSKDGSTNYYGMDRNPFKNLSLILDQEFKLSDTVQASIRPYYYWGNGGSFSSYTGGAELGPDADTAGVYDLSNLKGSAHYYRPSWTQTWRSGVYGNLYWQFNQQNNLNLGYWYEHAKQVQTRPFIALDDNGNPTDTWGNPSRGSGVVDANGRKVQGRNQSTATPSQKVWLRDRWYINDDWELNAGIAYEDVVRRGQFNGSLFEQADSIHTHYHGWLPELNLSYSIDDANMLYANVTRNMKTPPNYALYNGGDSASSSPEKSWNKELGWRYQSQDLQLGVSLFDMSYKNRLVSTQNHDGDYELLNLGDVDNKGIEFNYKQQLPVDFNTFASFTYTDAKQHNDLTSGDDTYATSGKHVANVPSKILNLGAGYAIPDFYLNLSGNFSSGFYGDQDKKEHIGGRAVYNLDGGVRLFAGNGVVKDTWLRFAVDNLLNRHYLSSVATTVFSADDSTPFYNVGAERTLTLSLEAQF